MANENKPDQLSTTAILKKYHLNLQEEMFCQCYSSPTEFFGNGCVSYGLAYALDMDNPKQRAYAAAAASKMLAKPKIGKRIDDILVDLGFNDQMADKRLSELMLQREDKSVALGALKEYNKLKARIQDKLDLTTAGEPIVAFEVYPYIPPTHDDTPIPTRDS